MIVKDVPQNPAAVMAGSLALGDPRVCALVSPIRHSFDASQTEVISKCFSGFTAKCVVEFYLDWLEELVDRHDYEGLDLFGHVAAGLCRLADRRRVPFITDGLRPFPVPGKETATDWSSVTMVDPDEFARSIADRLHVIEQREGAPKVMPHAIRAFGLTPKTPVTDTPSALYSGDAFSGATCCNELPTSSGCPTMTSSSARPSNGHPAKTHRVEMTVHISDGIWLGDRDARQYARHMLADLKEYNDLTAMSVAIALLAQQASPQFAPPPGLHGEHLSMPTRFFCMRREPP